MKLLGVEMPKIFANLCTPAQVYVILGVIGQIGYLFGMFSMNNSVVEAEPEGGHIHLFTFLGLVLNIAVIALWTALLNYICQFKYGKKISWFLVLFPIIFSMILFVGLFSAASFIMTQNIKNKELMKQVNNQ
jgi:hypothetical protein